MPVLLVVLVGVFATLQYRWLGQASEADREQMRQSISERAQAFAEDFDRELGSASVLFELTSDVPEGDAGPILHERLARWRAASQFPELIAAVYVAHDGDDAPSLRRLTDAQSLEEIGWPAHLETVRTRPAGTRFEGERPRVRIEASDVRLQARPMSIAPDVPALILPTTPMSAYSVIVELDREEIISTVLPELARQHFPDLGGEPYRITVLDQTRAATFTSGEGAADIQPEQADAAATFLQFRPEALRQRTIFARQVELRDVPPPDADVIRMEFAPAASRMVTFGTPPWSAFMLRADMRQFWTLLVQHPLGSIDAAVDAGRRRNLWVSFGLLAVLATGVALVVVNARRAEHLATKQMEFVATVSHELRTPVAVMRSAAQNLSAGVIVDADRARRYGELIENEGRRLTEMVEQVLEFAGGGSARDRGAFRPVDPVAVARDAVDSCRSLAESEGVAIETRFGREDDADASLVQGDAEALRRAVVNLITNALKHGGDGRWIGVDVRRHESGSSRDVDISVRDRGRGIDTADLPHLFEPFYRGGHAVDQQVQGSGLGLSLVQRIAEAHGGRVSVQSVPGSGSTFTIHLPA